MLGTTYSRTSGHAILPGTWDYIRSRGDVPDPDRLNPADRYNYDTASAAEREAFIRLSLQALTTPPAFLRFALAGGIDALTPYPGEVDAALGHSGEGKLVGFSQADAVKLLGLADIPALELELTKFSGPVSLVALQPGQKIFRTVGLTAVSAKYGSVTNKLLGNYWEQTCPSTYDNEAQWRADTAVLAEWNGDYGYIEATLAKPITALLGKVGMQKLARQGSSVLPGGGMQLFIAHIDDASLAEPIASRRLIDVIQPTQFGMKGAIS